MPMSARVVAAATAGVLILGVAPTALAAQAPVAPPPSPQQIAAATNAMLGFDLPTLVDDATGTGSAFTTGYVNPPGGQDPLPVCVYGPGYATVSVPDTLAIGYAAHNGYVGQSVYEYPSQGAADRAWTRLDGDISDHCRGSWTSDRDRVTVSRSRLAASANAGAGWLVTTVGLGSVTVVAVSPVGDAIQVVSYTRQADSLRPRVPATIAALSTRLADRWVRRGELPMTQGALVNGAALSALSASDVPATLPVTSPSQGGWSSYSASEPGNGPYTCAAPEPRTQGSWSMVSSLGGTGDIVAEPGMLMQNIEVYPSNDAALAAWNRLSRAVLACNDPGGNPMTTRTTASRTLSGVSELTFGGVPGVWSREFTVYGGFPMSAKAYSISLMSGNVIQSLTYYTTEDGVTQIPLDQVAVNSLAVTLLERWNATQAAQTPRG